MPTTRSNAAVRIDLMCVILLASFDCSVLAEVEQGRSFASISTARRPLSSLLEVIRLS
jgi:hypothetical protein